TSGVMGSLGSALLNPSAVSVGASGGILGLLGVAIVLEKARFGSVSPTSIVVALLAVGGGFLEGVDVVAHASGFVVGLLMGWLFLSSSEYAYEAR
ncbi:MAG TPA: rhomboid family intramembrane serine protease, partial [Candidatus Korarchaeota archaeon]|nr:rhomboid family intramembrane serine protease [Candidatus Korarchaeota archaeon]